MLHVIYTKSSRTGQILYWNTCGWTDRARNARLYRSDAEVEQVLRRMMIDNVKAKIEVVAETQWGGRN